MRNLIDFSIMHEYNKNVLPRGYKLLSIAGLVDWKRFSPIADGMYKNNTERGGRPNIDIIIMIKLLLLQEMFGLSDPQLELQVANRISFRVFLGTTETIPDYTTVWTFRKRLTESGKYDDIWDEFINQLRARGYGVTKGMIQDASFITSDPGHAKKDVPRGDESTLHDSQVDLAEVGEVRYGDKAYSEAKTKGYDASMKRAARGHPLGIFDILRNKRVSKKRFLVERCFSVIKTVFRSGHVMVTTVENAAMKVIFKAIGYNLYNLHGLVNKEVV